MTDGTPFPNVRVSQSRNLQANASGGNLKTMKILFICYELPPLGGGGGRAALQIARRLAGRGHEVAILSSLFEGLRESEEDGGVRICRIRVRRKRSDECSPLELISFMLRSRPAARRMADEFHPDVACAFFGIPGGPAALHLLKRRNIPYVVALRGSDVPRPELAKHQRLHMFTGPFLRRLYRRAAGIVSVSESLKQAALRVAPDVAIDVVPNGVDTDWFSGAAERPAGGPLELLYVGRLKDFKGVQHIIRALPAIEEKSGHAVCLTVAGDGPYRAELEKAAAETHVRRSHVEFAGWLEREALRAAYGRASLLILPSLVEGNPNVVLEAMAMGAPCIGTDAPGIRDLICDGVDGFLTPPSDPAAIAEAVARAVSNPASLPAMGRAARAKAEQFSWDAIAAQYEQALARAAKGGECAT